MDEKHRILKESFGYDEFRQGQEDLIDAIADGRDVLGIMPTGSGKSLCYQVPALMLEGITLVISPLISLMADQVAALKNAGIPGAFINSSLTAAQTRTAYKRCLQGQYKIIYVAPERLQTQDFLRVFRQLNIAQVAVDEAHCISQWGQDFRPSYLRITDFLDSLPVRPVVSAFTATATEKVAEDIVRALGLQDPLTRTTGFDRPNLYFEVLRPRDKMKALLELMEPRREKSGIIYCATRKETETVCRTLQEKGYAATRYHAGLSEEERRENQQDFIYDRSPIIAATNAFGMGINKSNVSFVIHYNMPKSMEEYYQEAGRAGRDGTAADCILLYSTRDVQTARFLIQTPSEGSDLTPEQQDLVTRQDYLRLEKMIAYCTTHRCLRGCILDYFGQAHGETCGSCGNCRREFRDLDITECAGKILSCIRQIHGFLGYYVGEHLLAQVLRGSRDKRLLELGLDRLECYGSLRELSSGELSQRMDCLREEGLVCANYVHGTLETGEGLQQVLDGERTVVLKLPAEEQKHPDEKKTPARTVSADSALVQRLKALRMQIARREGVPVYIVFSNASLQDMAEKQPRTMEEFLQVSGVGQYKADRYGEAFLEALNRETAGEND